MQTTNMLDGNFAGWPAAAFILYFPSIEMCLFASDPQGVNQQKGRATLSLLVQDCSNNLDGQFATWQFNSRAQIMNTQYIDGVQSGTGTGARNNCGILGGGVITSTGQCLPNCITWNGKYSQLILNVRSWNLAMGACSITDQSSRWMFISKGASW